MMLLPYLKYKRKEGKSKEKSSTLYKKRGLVYLSIFFLLFVFLDNQCFWSIGDFTKFSRHAVPGWPNFALSTSYHFASLQQIHDHEQSHGFWQSQESNPRKTDFCNSVWEWLLISLLFPLKLLVLLKYSKSPLSVAVIWLINSQCGLL